MIPIKKSACAALAGAILLSMTGCSAINSEEDVYDAGDSFAKVMKALGGLLVFEAVIVVARFDGSSWRFFVIQSLPSAIRATV